MPWRGPSYPGELPTLGWYVLDWFERMLIVPDGMLAGEPFIPSREQAQFILNFYALNPMWTGQLMRGSALMNARRYRRAVYSRVKGAGKSPLMSAMALCEALAEIVPAGWDARGEPVGRTWASLGFKPKVQVVAVSEAQTTNTWDPVLEMARNGPVFHAYDIDPMETFISVPRGRIEYVTSSGTSREGFRPVFAVLDQTESWVKSNGGVKLAAAIRRNLTKTSGSSVETPNAFLPGEDSVAEKSHDAFLAQSAGKLKGEDSILYDHREAPADTDPADLASLLKGLSYAYGDSADVNGGWVSLDRVVADYWDPDTDPQDARRYYLNQITNAIDSWLSQPEVAAAARPGAPLVPGDMISLGFDGSLRRARGIADATALMGCRVHDGHIVTLGVWEQPQAPGYENWQTPTIEVDALVDEMHNKYNVVAFYGDPQKWETYIARWEAKYGKRYKVKATRDHPIEWWMSGGRSVQIVRALASFHSALISGQLTHDNSSVLIRHLLNARRRTSQSGLQIAKEHPDSPRKIDAAIAAVLAWEARNDAIAAGVLDAPAERYAPVRLR